MRRLFFLHKKNKAKVRNLTKKDAIIYMDLPLDGGKERDNLNFYLDKIADKAKQERFGYKSDWTQTWAFAKSLGNKSFAQNLVFEGKSLWYALEYFLHFEAPSIRYVSLSYDRAVSTILLYIDSINFIIKEKKPQQVIIDDGVSWFNKLIERICKQKKIGLISLDIGEQKERFASKIINKPSIARNYLRSRILLRRTIGRLWCKKLDPKDVLILTSDRLTDKENLTDYYWGPIVKELNKKRIGYKMIEYDRIEAPGSIKKVRERYFPQKYDAQFIGTYYDTKTMKNISKIDRFLRKKFRELDKRADFKKSFRYQGINFYDLIRPRLEKTFLVYSIYIADVYAIAKSIIEKEKPRIVLIDHEKNYYGRALITEAKKKRIPSFAFEAELIYENSAYITQVPIKEMLNEKSPLWRPIPNKKLLWGEYNKGWYKEKNYFPEKNLVVIGSPKYDFLKKLNKKDKEEIRKEYGLKKDEKLVVVITVYVPWEKEYMRYILQSLNPEKKVRLIAKMHPNEPLLAKEMIEGMLKKYKVKGIALRYGDASRLMYAADLVVTCTSTLVYECVFMNKNTVLIELGYDIHHPYISSGLLKNHTNPDEIKEVIKKALAGKKELNPQQRQSFLREYLYSDDGKASDRAVSYIQAELRKIKK